MEIENVTMPHKEETTICEFCRKGHNIRHLEDIAFRQWSDIGWISCRVAVSIDVCNVCNARTLRGGDKILDEAFQREYDKAANSSRTWDAYMRLWDRLQEIHKEMMAINLALRAHRAPFG